MRVSECGFDPYERDDGLHARGPDGGYDGHQPRYNQYLNDKGYPGDNPWHDCANAAQGEGNALASGWAMRNARKPARVKEEDSETPYMTRRAMEFIRRDRREAVVPASFLHQAALALHRAGAIQRHVQRRGGDRASALGRARRVDPHPVFREFMAHRVSHAFARDEVRNEVIPVYMGLIKQIDDQMGVLFRFLEQNGYFDNTMIVFTSDHGDYLGDHWLGEKEFFHEPSVKIPLIIYDPRTADATRGTICDELVEAIDLAPTFLDALGADPADQSHRLEGRSLMPLLRGQAAPAWRPYTISEYDYSIQPAAADLRVAPRDTRLFMIADKRWKYDARHRVSADAVRS